MVRPRRCRRIGFIAKVNYFKPAGVPLAHLSEEIISNEELEAVRLTDLEEQEQTKVAEKMEISQPTLSRLLKTGRRKIARALVEGKAIKVDGGNFKFQHFD